MATKKCPKVKQSPQRSPRTKKRPKKDSAKKRTVKVIDSYKDMLQGLTCPVTQSTVEAIARRYVEWAQQEDSLVLKRFPLSIGMLPRILFRWIDKYPEIEAAHTIARDMVAARREEGALKNKLNSNIVTSQQARYDSDWWELEKKRYELKASLQDKGDRNVVFKVVQEPVEKVEDKEK